MGIRSRAAGFKPGDIKAHTGTTLEAGWLYCAGQAISRTAYAALFAAIGTMHGAGDGSTTFNLPDLRGRALFGKDNMGGSAANRLTTGGAGVDGATLGAAGGGQTVTLTSSQIATHAHTVPISNAGVAGTATGNLMTSGGSVNSGNNSGGGGAHANIPPALVANFIIKT